MLEKVLDNPITLMEYAEHLYAIKDYRTLEEVFGKYLKKSYNLNFWMLYINYVKNVSQKKFKLYDVYEFTLAQFENYWGSYGLYRDYIEELEKLEDEQTRIDKIRDAYMKALQVPMENLSELWRGFEDFELELNKTTGKKIVSEMLPAFQNSFQRYQAISPLIRNWSIKNAAKLIDLEIENANKTGMKVYGVRMHFIHKYILDTFYYSEEGYFFYSEYMLSIGRKDDAKEILQNGMKICKGLFLYLYYGLIMEDGNVYMELKREYIDREKNLDNVQSEELDLLEINHLNYVLKKKGVEAFRQLFIELSKGNIGPYVFIYCALVEYYATGDRKTLYNIFSSGLAKHPDSTLLKENFFLFLLKIGDEENARALFKRLEKTNKMWDSMIEYEFMVGSIGSFRELSEQKMLEIKNNTILPDLPEREVKKTFDGVLGKYHCFFNSFNFFGLKIGNSLLIDEFLENIPQISQQNNMLLNVKFEKILDVLKMLML